MNVSVQVLDVIRTKWEYIVDNYNDEEEVFLPVFVAWLIFFATYWIYGLSLLVLEVNQALGFEKRKHQPDRPFKFEKTSYGPSFYTLFKNVTFNWVFIILPTLYAMQKLLKPIGLGVYVSRELPSLIQVVVHAALAPVVTDITFFHSHYLLHKPWFYKRVHKVHHEFKAPYGLCCIYAHWFEALVGNTIAIMGVAFFLNIHCLEWWIAGVLGWMGTTAGHSGARLPFVLHERKLKTLDNPKGGQGFSNFHDYHHQFFTGNYGQGVLVDWLYGTDKAWNEYCHKLSRSVSEKKEA